MCYRSKSKIIRSGFFFKKNSPQWLVLGFFAKVYKMQPTLLALVWLKSSIKRFSDTSSQSSQSLKIMSIMIWFLNLRFLRLIPLNCQELTKEYIWIRNPTWLS